MAEKSQQSGTVHDLVERSIQLRELAKNLSQQSRLLALKNYALAKRLKNLNCVKH
jgi:hypothetical protein